MSTAVLYSDLFGVPASVLSIKEIEPEVDSIHIVLPQSLDYNHGFGKIEFEGVELTFQSNNYFVGLDKYDSIYCSRFYPEIPSSLYGLKIVLLDNNYVQTIFSILNKWPYIECGTISYFNYDVTLQEVLGETVWLHKYKSSQEILTRAKDLNAKHIYLTERYAENASGRTPKSYKLDPVSPYHETVLFYSEKSKWTNYFLNDSEFLEKRESWLTEQTVHRIFDFKKEAIKELANLQKALKCYYFWQELKKINTK